MRKLLVFVVIFAFAYLFTNEAAFAVGTAKKINRKKAKTEEVVKESEYKKMTGRDSLDMSGVVNVIGPHLLCSSIPNTEKHCNIL